jgi:hypothetical protein
MYIGNQHLFNSDRFVYQNFTQEWNGLTCSTQVFKDRLHFTALVLSSCQMLFGIE